MNLMQGDCLKRMQEIPDGSVDMVLTDPPYGTTACKWDTVIDLPLMWEQLKRVIKPNGAIVMTASQPFTSALVMSNPKMFKYDWCWSKSQKTGHLNAKKMPLRSKEDVIVFYSRQPNYIPQMGEGKKISRTVGKSKNRPEVYGKFEKQGKPSGTNRYPHSIISISAGRSPHTKHLHPTQKPVALLEYLIRTYTNEGETVLDFTMGSGTTGVACVNLDRKFIGIELDKDYFEIAEKRIKEAKDKRESQLF
jgi:site-specific DNA-methyltransferase (adenine-specific)